MSRQTPGGGHAVVLGASMAGLLAARVLSDSHGQVTLVERDVIRGVEGHRHGVPQGHHVHAVQACGREMLEEMFPGLTSELVAAGAETGDHLANIRWQLSGRQWLQADAGVLGLFVSRPFLEKHVRDRVLALPGVALHEGYDIAGLEATADGTRVTGASIVQRGGGRPISLSADLVIDATGRGSRSPVWLAALGYQRPRVDEIEIDLGYASRTYRLRPDALGTDRMIVTGGIPVHARSAIITAVEGGRHMLSAAGMLGDHPSTDSAGFDAFVANLLFPDIAEAIVGAEPLNDPLPFRFPASIRHRYEHLRRFPAGLLVLGDAVCSFNPVYGQGMTVAAMQAQVLGELLADGRVPSARRYFKRIAKVVDAPWQIAAGGDLAHPDVPGNRTLPLRVINAYMRRLQAAAARDTTLADAFLRVASLVEPPQALLRPDRAMRVLRSTVARRRARGAAARRAASTG